MNPSNSHDLFVRRIFSNKEESIAFFKTTLEPELIEMLELEKLTHTQESFISESQKEHRTDILYEVPLKSGGGVYIYILFEHKSYNDPKIFTQLLGYLAEIYKWQEENTKNPLKVVIPFVFYHGETEWKLGLNFADKFGNLGIAEKMKKYIPDFTIKLFELDEKSKEFHSDHQILNFQLGIIQKIRTEPEEFLRTLRKAILDLSRVEEEYKRVAVLRNLLEYIFSSRKDGEKYYNIQIYKEVEEEYMTFLEQIIEKGKLEGMEKGIEKGIEKGKLEDARLMKVKGYPVSDILEITGLSETQLKENGIL
jgi:predicted transposase/invertase (TIGR01784 family)